MASKSTEKIIEGLTQLFEGYFELKENLENDLEPEIIDQDEENDADDEEESSDIESALASHMKLALETVIEGEDYTPNDMADLLSAMTEALQEIAPDVFEEGEEEEDDEDEEETYEDEDFDDDDDFDDDEELEEEFDDDDDDDK